MARFFCYLSLFASGMLGLILANNLLLLFMCWEIVGVASYLLISFWNHKPEAAAAGKKAFIVTRIGDIGFLIGILLAFKYTGTLTLYDGGNGLLESGIAGSLFDPEIAAIVSLLLFLGAVGKSGQLPLHVWLPDAMEGPTPVSALIHAATMVARQRGSETANGLLKHWQRQLAAEKWRRAARMVRVCSPKWYPPRTGYIESDQD